jgi:SIR2-like domain
MRAGNSSQNEPAQGGTMGSALFEQTRWEVLVDSIGTRECTPFLGAGVSVPALPTGGQLASELAEQFRSPLVDVWNLPRVGQYIATTREAPYAKRQVARRIKEQQQAYHPGADDPHVLLAALDLPIYVTTNWDSLMVRALRDRGRDPIQELARWNSQLSWNAGEFTAFEPTPERPLVYHLHGHADQPASLVLTEDDYVDFVAALARDLTKVVPEVILEALSWTSLLFVGYSLNDWNFHVLLRLLMSSLAKDRARGETRRSVSIQIPNKATIAEGREDDAKQFISDYLGSTNVDIHWVEAKPFLVELQERYAGFGTTG